MDRRLGGGRGTPSWGMGDSELIRRAEAAGIMPVYRNWLRQETAVSAETLSTILEVLERTGSPAAEHPAGRGGPRPARLERRGTPGIPDRRGAAAIPAIPDSRSWGFTVQLYSLRSRDSWGHGDFRDLADLAAWSAKELGAGFVLINPLHAAEPLPPLSASPYLPMTRHYISPLYLRIEDVPEFGRLPGPDRAAIAAVAAPLLARDRTAELIDRDAVWAAKRAALELIHAVPLDAERRAEYERFREREGAELTAWSAWCALAERHGADWRRWPAEMRQQRPGAQVVRRFGLESAAEFHAWLQWLADEQLAAAQDAALSAGMPIGIVCDLAVGVHPGGADAWAHQDLLVSGMSVGAPPDGFNQLGQDWAQPPPHPGRLAATGYRPMAELFGSGLRHAGGLRVDHVMGLMRLWWIPEGMPPERGAYVRYDHAAAVGALASQAARAGAVAIGEDLGTVDPWIRRYLSAHGILGTTLLWFAHERSGAPLRPSRWRRRCMATVGTHDVPPVSGFASGEQVDVRARLGLLKDPVEERGLARSMLSRWQAALAREGLLDRDREPDAAELTVALYGYLARTPAVLVGVSLADAVGDRQAQNIPGTSQEYPNWRVPLCAGDGSPVLLEDLPALPLVQAVARAALG